MAADGLRRHRAELLGLWRYQEPEYADFKQCVLLARRREKALNKTKLTFPRWASSPDKWPVLRDDMRPVATIQPVQKIPTLRRIRLGNEIILDTLSRSPLRTSLLREAAAPAPPRRSAGAFRVGVISADPIDTAQVVATMRKTFPNVTAELRDDKFLSRALENPSMRGQLRGRIAESDWINRNAEHGWKPVKSPIASQNDAVRFVNGKPEGAQVKVYSNWKKYIPEMMNKDTKAEYFVLPDDHYVLVHVELESRRLGALRGGLFEKALDYAKEQKRLTKLGRTFGEFDGAIESATLATKALRLAGETAAFVGIALSVLDGGIAVYEYGTGKLESNELLAHLSKTVVGGGSAWIAGDLAAGAAVAAGAAGTAPAVIAIVVGAVTYYVVEMGVDFIATHEKSAHLNLADIDRILPRSAKEYGK